MASKVGDSRKGTFSVELEELPPQPIDKLSATYDYATEKSDLFLRFLKSLKVEVITFVYMFAYIIRSVSSMTMIMDKVCRVNIGYSDFICDDMSKYPAEKAKVEIMANNFHLYHTLIQITPSAILACFIGPWSDLYGRKLPIICALIGISIDGIGATLCAVYLHTGVEYYLVPAIFTGMSGGFITVFTVVYSYVSDLTPSKSRTFKYALMEMALGLAMPLGTLAGGWIYKYHGYVPVFATSLAGHLFGLFWVIVVMDETRGMDNRDTLKMKLKNLFSCHNFVDSFKATIKQRPHRGRLQIILMMLATSLLVLALAGTANISYLYVHHRYGWDNTKFSTVSASFAVMGLIVMLVTVPLLTKVFKLGDPTLGIIGSISVVAKLAATGLADKEWIYYTANLLGLQSSLATLASRARISKVVSKNDLGKVFAFLSTAESLLPILASAFVVQLFNWSVKEEHPGITYLVMAALLVFTLITFLWLACLPSVNYEEIQEEEEAKGSGNVATDNIKPTLTSLTPAENEDS